MKALILAAGLGTRLRPFTLHTPKPLFTLNRRPLLDIIVDRLVAAGCRGIMVNTHHLHTRIEAFLAGQNYPIPVQTRYEPAILGTGGAIANVADFWTDRSLLVVNADIVSDIDLAMVYRHHETHAAPVTMVLHDEPRFNSVLVNAEGDIIGFDGARSVTAPQRKLAFTGIHVLDRRVLDYLPDKGAAHIIDAYEAMIAAGEGPRALVVQGHYWRDIGTPDSYQATVMDHMAPIAFARAGVGRPEKSFGTETLQGDGSDRRWLRLTCGGSSLIAADHGIRAHLEGPQEADAFVAIGTHLHRRGVAVPRIYAQDTFSGVVILEDLGSRHLQDAAREEDPETVLQLYRSVIRQWRHMATAGAAGFDVGWTYQSTHYDRQLILEKECRYFVEAFVNGYLQRNQSFNLLIDEFDRLADQALSLGVTGFMHRDFQSRNIMIKNGTPYFIDFQGGRLGPLQYDLASLLIDPYARLPVATQETLLAFAADEMSAQPDFDRAQFLAGYRFCRLTRNLQMLGAFGYLTRVKGKDYFEAFIPIAVATLRRNLQPERALFPKLTALAEALHASLGATGDRNKT